MPPRRGLNLVWVVVLQRCRADGAGKLSHFKHFNGKRCEPAGLTYCHPQKEIKQDLLLYDKRRLSYNKRGLSYDKRPLLYDKRRLSYDKRGLLYDARGLLIRKRRLSYNKRSLLIDNCPLSYDKRRLSYHIRRGLIRERR